MIYELIHMKILLLILAASVIFISGCINEEESILWNGRTRFYNIHIPDGYNGITPVPLVIALHGGGGNARSMEEKTGFSNLSDEKGFVIVYPEGTGRFKHRFLTWNAGYCCGYALENNIDDVGFIKELIKTLEEKFNIDSNRIYITGHSNGAMLTYRVGAELSDIVAAIAPVAGAIPKNILNLSTPSKPVSVLVISGTDDPLIPWNGGDIKGPFFHRNLGKVLSVPDSVAYWVAYNNCNSSPNITYLPDKDPNDGTLVCKKVYSGGDNGTEVILYTIEGGGHTWPGGSQYWPKKFIGATWDMGHINMLKKQGFTNKEIIRETKKIAPYVKHVHITDNFGFDDSHLSPGMGNVPIKKVMKE